MKAHSGSRTSVMSTWFTGTHPHGIHLHGIHPHLTAAQLWVQSPHGLFTEELDLLILVGHFQLRTFCGSVTHPHRVHPQWDQPTWGFIHTRIHPFLQNSHLGNATPSLGSNPPDPNGSKAFLFPSSFFRVNLKPSQPQPCRAQPRGIPQPPAL